MQVMGRMSRPLLVMGQHAINAYTYTKQQQLWLACSGKRHRGQIQEKIFWRVGDKAWNQ
jgi:hypothetical protein